MAYAKIPIHNAHATYIYNLPWYFGHLMQRADSFEKILMLRKIEGGRRRGWQRMGCLDGIIDSMDMSLNRLGVGDGQGGLACFSPRGHKELDTTEQLNWTELGNKLLLTNCLHICFQAHPSLYESFWNLYKLLSLEVCILLHSNMHYQMKSLRIKEEVMIRRCNWCYF